MSAWRRTIAAYPDMMRACSSPASCLAWSGSRAGRFLSPSTAPERPAGRSMKLAGILALLLGLLAGTLLIAHYGVAAVGESLLTIGWTGFLVIILLHLAILFLCGIAW